MHFIRICVLYYHVSYNVALKIPSVFCQCMDILETVAFNLRRIRVAKGVSQDDLALSSNVERAYVGHIERGKKNPTLLTLDKLAKALDCRVGDFFEEVDPDAQNPNLIKGRKKNTDDC